MNHHYLDSRFSGERPVVQGYAFAMTVSASGSFAVNADPKENDGQHFFMDQNNTIHFNDEKPASASDPASNGI